MCIYYTQALHTHMQLCLKFVWFEAPVPTARRVSKQSASLWGSVHSSPQIPEVLECRFEHEAEPSSL